MGGHFDSLFNNSLFFKYKESTLFVLGFTLAMILVKVFAASITIGSGGNGGIFGPSLFTGSLLGFFFSHLINYTGITTLSEHNFIAVAMGGLISGVLHAPLTGIFLIAEITGGYILFVPLMIVSAMAYFIVRYFEPNSIYTKTLIERGYITRDKDADLLSQVSLSSVIENDFSMLYPDQKLRELVQIIARSSRNIFPVVDERNRLVGIVTLDDIRDVMFKQSLYNTMTVMDVMSAPRVTVNEEEKMESVMNLFDEHEVWYIPVTDQNQQYLGFISKSGVLTQYREQLKSKDDVVA